MKKITMTLAAAVLCISAAAWAGSLFPVDEHGMPEEAGKAVANSIASLLRVKGPGATGEAKSLAVITEGGGSKDFADHIVRSLSESGGYIIIDRAQAEAAAMKSSRNGIALAQEVMSALKLQALVVVRSWPGEGQDLLAVRVFSRKAVNEPETMLFALKKQHGREVRTSAPLPGAAAPVRLELAGNYEIPVAARYMAVIDLDGDGSLEYVFSDEKKLYLYRREGEAWKSLWTSSDRDERHYYLAAADVNGNGKPEIYVAAMRSGKVVTTAYEEKSGTLEAVTELPGFARVLSIPGRGLVLLRQDHDKDKYFGGTPRIVTFSAGRHGDGEEFPLPKGIGLYDFVLADLGEQSPLMAATESDGRAGVYSRGTLVWKSEEWYRGAETVLVEASRDIYSGLQKVSIRGRLLASDLTGSGREYVVFPKNKKVMFGTDEGAFHVFAWTGARLERVAAVQDLPGPVLDMQARGGMKEGSFMYVLVQVEGGMFSGPGARLLVYQVL